MRLSVFIANQPSSQLITDLQKIYLVDLPEQSLTEQVIDKLFAQANSRLFMTMFNERHIGAVKVTTEAKKSTLSKLCIREITRRRGIGKNLLREVEKKLVSEGVDHIQYDLSEVKQNVVLATQAFLMDSGYLIDANIASKQI